MESVIAALNAVHSPSTSLQDRKSANEMLENMKHSPLCIQTGLELLSIARDVNALFFGLSLLEHAVRFGWNSVSQSDKLLLRDQLAQILSNQAGSSLPPFITQKACAVLAQVAERMWPVEWPEFDTYLCTLFAKDPASQEKALLIYKAIMEDMFIFESSIADTRKKDLSVSLMAITLDANVLNHVYCSNDRVSQKLSKQTVNVDYVLNVIRADPQHKGWLLRLTQNMIAWKKDNVSTSTSKKLIQLSLETIGIILHWIILEGIQSSNILPVLFEFLMSESFHERMAAAECLSALFSRSSLVTEELFWPAIVTPLMEGDGFLLSTLFRSVQAVYSCQNWDMVHDATNAQVLENDAYEYLKKIAELVSVFGEDQVFYKQMTQAVPHLERYLELLVYFTCHPSCTVSSLVVHVWAAVASHPLLKDSPELSGYRLKLIQFCIQRLSEGDSEFISTVSAAYDSADFDCKQDRTACIAANGQRYLDLLRFLMLNYSIDVCSMVQDFSRGLLTAHPNLQKNEFGFIQTESATAVHFESASTLIEHVIRNLDHDKVVAQDPKFDSALFSLLSAYFQDILAFESMDPIVRRFLMSAYVCIAEVARDNSILLTCIEKIVNCVTFTLPDEVDFIQRSIILREETRNLRMKAATALIKLAIAVPDMLIPLFGQFMQLIQSFIAENKVTQAERVKLIEFLIAVIDSSSISASEKSAMFTSILEGYVQEWEGLDPTPFISSDSLLGYLGIMKVVATGIMTPDDLTEISKWQQKVSISVRSWMSWMKRTTGKPSLWIPYLARIAPGIFAITHLSEPSAWANIPAHFHLNMVISEGAKDAILKKSTPKHVTQEENKIKVFLHKAESWIAGMREACYSVMGAMISFGPSFFMLPNVYNQLGACLFGPFSNHLGTRHWRTLIGTVIRPLLINCPMEARGLVFSNLFLKLVEFMKGMLAAEWEVIEKEKKGVENTVSDDDEDEEPSKEVVAEKLLRDLTRVFADLLVAIVSPDQGKPANAGGGGKSKERPVLQIDESSIHFYVASDQTLFAALFGCLLQVMMLKDTLASRKALTAMIKCLPVLAKTKRADVFQYLGQTVMRTCLELFHDGYFQEIHNEAAVLMCDIYVLLRQENCSSAFETLVALPGMSVERLQAFDIAFMEPGKMKRDQHILLKDILKNIKGASLSETFKETSGKIKMKPVLLRNQKVRDLLEADGDDENLYSGDSTNVQTVMGINMAVQELVAFSNLADMLFRAHWGYSWATAITEGIAITLNLIIILSNVRCLHKLPQPSVLIVFLCCSDNITMINTFILVVHHLTSGSLDYNARMCQIQAIFITFGALFSLGLCAGLTLLRFLVIVTGRKITRLFIVQYIGSSAAIAFSTAILPFILGSEAESYVMQPSGDNCTVRWHSRDPRTVIVSCVCAVILVTPLTGIGFAYYFIYRKVSKTFESFKATGVISNEGKSVQTSSTGALTNASEIKTGTRHLTKQSKREKCEEEEKQMALLIQSLVVVGVFIVGWTPYMLYGTFGLLSGVSLPASVEFAADYVLQVNYLANPFVIFLFDKDIQKNLDHRSNSSVRNSLEYDNRLCQIHAAMVVGGAFHEPLSQRDSLQVTYPRRLLLPFLLGSQDDSYFMQPSGDNCTPRWHGRDPRTLIISTTCGIILATPLVGMGYTYFQIYRKVSTTFEAFRVTGVVSNAVSSQSSRALVAGTV
ncbi:hypothetical protein CcCBS67573_g04798 [Chytriomyces confervae]|uniref:G-protein coupled receptors family 1 profile domain-containing protein n=1 Tax=Chytriomyces confervae TaxID=246404 RepID=A0A507FDV3_9FUNG|nr:hypothetical protein CcCBS67573_g04798 [Chytriomyces confervae]